MMWLFVAEAKDLEPEIEKRIGDGEWIVCDRHTQVSGLVYQGEVHGAPTVDEVTKAAELRLPDRIFILDVPAEVALERRGQRGEARNVLYEPEDRMRINLMRASYRDVANIMFPQTAKILDGTLPLDENLRAIWTDLGLPGAP